MGARFSAPVHTGLGAHPVSYTVGTGSFPGVKSGRGVTLTPHPLLVPWSRKGRAIPLLLLRAVRPVQSLSACKGVNFTFFYLPEMCEPVYCTPKNLRSYFRGISNLVKFPFIVVCVMDIPNTQKRFKTYGALCRHSCQLLPFVVSCILV